MTDMSDRLYQWSSTCLQRHGHTLLIAVCFLLPIRLLLAYLPLVPLLILWLLQTVSRPTQWISRLSRPEAVFCFFLGAMLFGSFCGLDIGTSLSSFLPTIFFCLLYFVVCDLGAFSQRFKLITALALGQSIAGLHTIAAYLVASVWGYTLPDPFTGPVTEAGQLAIVLPLTIAAILAAPSPKAKRSLIWLATILTFALIFNLKRGPWLGAACGIGALFLCTRPKFVIPLVFAALTIWAVVPSVQERISDASRDFYIAGGRSEMWEIGADILPRFPFGIGYRNSKVLRQYSNLIPPTHRHFHNNLLNITIEGGLLTGILFLYWLGVSLYPGLRIVCSNLRKTALATDVEHERHLLVLGACAALFSNQLAGIIEYNFGDADVRNLMLIAAGIIVAWQKVGGRDRDLPQSLREG